MKTLFDTIKEESKEPNKAIETLFKFLEDSKTETVKLAEEIGKIPDKTVNVNINTQVNGTSKAVSDVQKDLDSLMPANFGVEGPGISRTESSKLGSEGPMPDSRSWTDKTKDYLSDVWESVNTPDKVWGQFKDAGNYIADSFSTAMKDMEVGEIIGKGLQMVLSGKQGAVSAVSAIGDALLPGIGGAISQLINLGPEGAKAMIQEFATSLPEVVVTLVESLAASADVIVESLIDSLLIRGGLERIVVALIQAIPRVAYKLVESKVRGLYDAIVAIGERFGLATFRELKTPEWVANFRDYIKGLTTIPEWVSKLQIKTPPWLEDFVEAVRKLTEYKGPNIGSGGGVRIEGGNLKIGNSSVGSDGVTIGGTQILAKGGVVPLYAANGAFVPRGTDTVPAMLTPGERVLTVQQNQSFEQLPMILAELVSVLSSPMTTETSIEIDGNRLADVILQLNRRNARVA
jgi:hypothetical protein